MNSLPWIVRLRDAMVAQIEEVTNNGSAPPETKFERIKFLEKARDRLNKIVWEAEADGLTTTLKAEIVQAVIEAEAGGLFGP